MTDDLPQRFTEAERIRQIEQKVNGLSVGGGASDSTVVEDDDGTIRFESGLLADGSYGIRVYDPTGTPVSTGGGESTDIPTASQIEFTPTGTISSNDVQAAIAEVAAEAGSSGTPPVPTLSSVKDYGAIGDGTSHPLSEQYATLGAAQAVYPHAVALTDQIDWAAAQLAANQSKPTYVPPGTYLFNRTCVLSNGASFWGNHVVGQEFVTGAGTCFKATNASNLDAVVATTNWYNNTTAGEEASGLHGICIDGNRVNQSSGLQHGFVNSSWKGYSENVTVLNCAGHGLLTTSLMRNGTTAYSGGQPEQRFHKCHVHNCLGGGIVNLHNLMTDGFVTDCIVWECAYGIYLNQSAGWVVEGNHTYGIGYDGITALNMLYTRISNNYSESFGQWIASGGTEARGIYAKTDSADAISQVTGNTIHLLLAATGAGSAPIGIRMESGNTGSTRAFMAASNNSVRHEHGGTPRTGSVGIKLVKTTGPFNVSGLETCSAIGFATNWSTGTGVVRQGFYTEDDGGTVSTGGWFSALTGTASQVALGGFGPSFAPGLAFGSTASVLLVTGTGTPEGAVTGAVGSLFLRTDGGAGTTLYVKQSGTGNTGWVAK